MLKELMMILTNKTFLIDKFDYELLQEFIQFSNDYWDFSWTIFLDVEDGFGMVSENIRNLIITHAESIETKVICNRAFNVGFMFFASLPDVVHRSLTYGCVGAVKLTEGTVSLNSTLKSNNTIDQVTKNTLALIRKREMYEIDLHLNPKEKKAFLKGEQIWFDYLRMSKIFNHLVTE